jgi:lysozyme
MKPANKTFFILKIFTENITSYQLDKNFKVYLTNFGKHHLPPLTPMKKNKKILIIFFILIFLIVSAALFFRKETNNKAPHPENIETAEVVRTPQSAPAWGIDLSHHNGAIQWAKMKGEHLPDFVFLKATEGTHFKDRRFENHHKEFSQLGVPCAGYHFFRFNKNGEAQARFFLDCTQPKKGDLLPVLDAESHHSLDSDVIAQKNIDLFMETIKKEIGVYPIVYCQESFYKKFFEEKYEGKIYLWISNFIQEPFIPYDIWQKSEKHRHPAFKGRIDYNVLQHSRTSLSNLLIP